MRRAAAVAVLAVLSAVCTSLPAQEKVPAITTSALINAALDKQVRLTLNQMLPQAMDLITRQTDVPITAETDIWELLPWGQETHINAKIENQTLREALLAITRKLGLTFQLKDESVELQPMPALRRLGRRATVEELGALDKLASTPLEGVGGRLSVKQLADAVDARLEALKLPFAVENRAGDAAHQEKAVAIPRNSSLLDALEELAKQTTTTWFPWGKTIVILDKQDQIRRQLGKTISLRVAGEDITQVLAQLQQKSGVDFEIQPGAVQRVPVESRNLRLMLDNVSVQEALELVAAQTGLGNVVRENGVYIWSEASAAPAAREHIFGIQTTDTGFQVLVPESQIPPDVREYLKYKVQKDMDKIRQMMKEEGFKPTSQPASKPATKPVDENL